MTTYRFSGVYPEAIVLALLSAIAALLNIPPLIWHSKHANFAPAFLIACILISNLFNLVNAAIWPNDDFSSWFNGSGLCDVHVKLLIANSNALPAATLCILRKLAKVMDPCKINLVPTKAQRTRAAVLDVVTCIGTPIVAMLLHFVVQSQRYAVTSVAGCVPLASNTLATGFCLSLPPLLLVVANTYFAAIIAIRLKSYSSRFNTLMQASNTTKSRFFRLFLLSMFLICIIFPIQLYLSFKNWPKNPKPYSWSRIHNYEAWQSILFVPSGGKVTVDRWVSVACGFMVFVFFGLGKDARDMYKTWATSLGLVKAIDKITRDRERPASSTDSQASYFSRARGHLLSSLFDKHDEKQSAIHSTTTASNDDLELATVTQSMSRSSTNTATDLLPKSESPTPCSSHSEDQHTTSPSVKQNRAMYLSWLRGKR